MRLYRCIYGGECDGCGDCFPTQSDEEPCDAEDITEKNGEKRRGGDTAGRIGRSPTEKTEK